MSKYKITKLNEPIYREEIWANNRKVKVVNDNYIFEDSSLQRVIHHAESGFFIISAFRGNYDLKENLERTDRLERDLSSLRFGYITQLGEGYNEIWSIRNRETNEFYSQANEDDVKDIYEGLENKDDWDVEYKKASEISFLVPYKTSYGSEEDFVKKGQELCQKYEQDSYLVLMPNFNNGKPAYVDKNQNIDFELASETGANTIHTKKPEYPYSSTLKKGDRRSYSVHNPMFKGEMKNGVALEEDTEEGKEWRSNVRDVVSKYSGKRTRATLSGINAMQLKGEIKD